MSCKLAQGSLKCRCFIHWNEQRYLQMEAMSLFHVPTYNSYLTYH